MKVVTYNVHNFQNSEKKYNYSDIYKDIILMNADLLILNECNKRNNQLEKIAEKLGYFFVFASTTSINFGNAIFSKKEITESFSIPLPYNRTALLCVIDGLRVCAVHLDHISENKREKQVNSLFSQVKDVDILVGDLNCLCKEDYNNEEWKSIEKERKENKWENPESRTITALQKDFYDSYLFSDETSLEKFTAHTRLPKYRIDYILFNRKKEWEIRSCVVRTDCIHSDHFPVEVFIDG